MIDALDPLLTFYREHPDFNASDAQQETRQLVQRQDAIERMLRGEEAPEFVLDLLEHQGVDPLAYVDVAVDNIDWVLSQGLQPDPETARAVLRARCSS